MCDLLPYEVPITFSNRNLYEFLNLTKLAYKADNFTWDPSSGVPDEVILLLLGLPANKEVMLDSASLGKPSLKKLAQPLKKGEISSIPFVFPISHKTNEFRDLAVFHPRNQIKAVEFYDTYKETILYYSNLSSYSIRSPHSVANCVYWNNRTRLSNFSEEAGLIEELGREYRSLRSFFVYKEYSNIFKFYESPDYHRCEKQYEVMVQLDISKCFDGIYTHSIAWALLGKAAVKNHLASLNKTFPEEFDRLMQQVNYNETNGILIGSELSRIFAELILQAVDEGVRMRLTEKGIIHKSDYEIFRYVDDFFVFFNKESVYVKLINELHVKLKDYKLGLNSLKEKRYEKPIITEITIAKSKISELLEGKVRYQLDGKLVNEGGEVVEVIKGEVKFSAKLLITEFKTIIKVSGVEYKDILNYTLAILERKCKKFVSDYLRISQSSGTERSFVHAAIGILEFVFFIYSVSPRVNTTIKLCRILNIFISFLRNDHIEKDCAHLIFKHVFDNIIFIMKKNSASEHTQIETLYLLVTLADLGKSYWLDEEVIAGFFGAKKNGSRFEFSYLLNYFSITVLFFYMKNKKRYGLLRSSLLDHVKERFKSGANVIHKDTELTLLLFDLLSSPFVPHADKEHLLDVYSIKDSHKKGQILNSLLPCFTRWVSFDFGRELDAKRSLDVY